MWTGWAQVSKDLVRREATCQQAACSCLLCCSSLSSFLSVSPTLSLSEKGVEPCRITLNKYSKGVGVGVGGEQAPPVEGFPQELLQGQKFTVVSISPFSSQSGNRVCTDPRAAGALTPWLPRPRPLLLLQASSQEAGEVKWHPTTLISHDNFILNRSLKRKMIW